MFHYFETHLMVVKSDSKINIILLHFNNVVINNIVSLFIENLLLYELGSYLSI